MTRPQLSYLALLFSAGLALSACSPAADAPAPEPEQTQAQDTAVPATNSDPSPSMADRTVPATALSSGAYMNDPNHTTLQLSVDHLGLAPYAVYLHDVDAQLLLDTDAPVNSTINVTADSGSVFTSYQADYSATHPNSDYNSWPEAIAGQFLGGSQPISFVTTGFDYDGDMGGELTGDLTLNGQTASVSFDVEITGESASHPMNQRPALGATAEGTILRSDFGIAPNMNAFISDEVTVYFSADFLKNSENDEPQ